MCDLCTVLSGQPLTIPNQVVHSTSRSCCFDSKLSHKCIENCTTASRCTIVSQLCIRNLKVRSTETLCPSSDLVFCPQDVNHLLGAFAWWWHYNGYSGNDINNECHLWWRCPSTKVYTFLQLTDWANIMCIILLYIYYCSTVATLSRSSHLVRIVTLPFITLAGNNEVMYKLYHIHL